MKTFVICITDDWELVREGKESDIIFPIKNGIYSIKDSYSIGSQSYYILHECGNAGFNVVSFRPVQNMDAEIEYIECTLMKDAVLEETLKELAI